MAELWENNSKEWFDTQRERYQKEVRDLVRELAVELYGPVAAMHPRLDGKPVISRINNDLRFHKNKSPYKEHVWISFGSKCEAELFVAVSRSGWCSGAMISANAKEGIGFWRKNLIQHRDLWDRWAKAVKLGNEVTVWPENQYRKPLFENVPEDVYPLVQSKQLYLTDKTKINIPIDPVQWLADGIAMLLPAYLFMTTAPTSLPAVLEDLGGVIPPMGERSSKVFQVLGG